MTIEFVVPGRPVPMARPRVTARGTYTPKRCREYKEAVALAAKAAMRNINPMEGAIICKINFYFEVPKSYKGEKKQDAINNFIRPTGRNYGDLDNLAKSIMDAIKGICWIDDSQVCALLTWKSYGYCRSWATVSIEEAARNAT